MAEICRANGLDAISSHECGRDGLTDEDQLRLAAADGRCFVTRNYGCFAALTHTFFQMGWAHPGVVFGLESAVCKKHSHGAILSGDRSKGQRGWARTQRR